jgi:hypothetical protein
MFNLRLRLWAVLIVDRILQKAGNFLLAVSDRWLFSMTADGPLEDLL